MVKSKEVKATGVQTIVEPIVTPVVKSIGLHIVKSVENGHLMSQPLPKAEAEKLLGELTMQFQNRTFKLVEIK